MKIRMGFVSNSSSSSFTCDVCGHSESGWDYGLEDVGMCRCVNDHTFCIDHFIPCENIQTFDDFLNDPKRSFGDGEDRHNIPSKYCPICRFDIVIQDQLFQYLKSQYGLTYEQLKTEMKSLYKNYDEMLKDIKK